MRRARRIALVALSWSVLAAPASASHVPLPENDPFHAVPKVRKLDGLRNGKILDSREVEVSALGRPMSVSAAWQVKYKTIDVHGDPSAYVTTVMVPSTPWTGPGPRPVVSYQTAEDGVGSKCSPSYGLLAGSEASDTNSGQETNAMAVALDRGIAVAAPDYEGPRSEFIGAKGEARGVIDGLRAALRFGPAGFDRARTPVGLWGYSGGALASSLAAQLQPRHAPELKLSGIALGGVVADLGATMRAFSGSAFGGALAVGLVGADRSYPELDIPRYLNERGRAVLAESQSDCIGDAVERYPFARIEDFTDDPAVLDQPWAVRFMRKVSPLWFPGTPSAPVYEYHAVLDELAPIGPARELIDRFCRAGVPAYQQEEYAGEHVSLVVTGALGALDYLEDRFRGEPAPSNCG